jgi:hypothetical protein
MTGICGSVMKWILRWGSGQFVIPACLMRISARSRLDRYVRKLQLQAGTAGHMMYKYFQKSNITIKKSNKIIAMSFFS